jgi:F420-non-reducing hydrogenase iron-sulfur subunit
MSAQFEPRIIAFLCRWCSYTGADLAGTSRIHYPPNVLPIRVMCSGRVDPTFVVNAFCGCHPGDCHYNEGNYNMLRRFPLIQKLISQFGIEPERVRLEWVSASEGDRYAEVVTEFTDQIRQMGPLNWGDVISAPPVEETAESEVTAS